jgi:hypothetical protein
MFTNEKGADGSSIIVSVTDALIMNSCGTSNCTAERTDYLTTERR